MGCNSKKVQAVHCGLFKFNLLNGKLFDKCSTFEKPSTKKSHGSLVRPPFSSLGMSRFFSPLRVSSVKESLLPRTTAPLPYLPRPSLVLLFLDFRISCKSSTMQLARLAVRLAEAPFSSKFSTALPPRRVSARFAAALKKLIAGFLSTNLLRNFFLVFRAKVMHHPYHHHGAHPEAESSSAGASNQAGLPDGDSGGSGDPNGSKSRKRKRSRKGKGKGKADRDEDPESTDVPSGVGNTKRMMACPFWRFNPTRYHKCGGNVMADYEAVRIHIRRKHTGRTDFYCPRCYEFFHNETERNLHIRRTGVDPCTPVPGHDDITAADWEMAKSQPCPRSSNCEEKWMWSWDTFFGRLPKPSPYMLHDNITETKNALIQLEPILTVLQNPRPYDSRHDQAAAIREALVHHNPGPGPYRVYHDESGQQTFVDPATHLARPRAPGAEADDPVIDDAELLQPIAEHLALPSRVPSLEPGFPSPSQTLFQLDGSQANPGPTLYPVLIPVAASEMVDAALAKLNGTPLSPSNENGPHWGQFVDYIDWGAFRQARDSGNHGSQVMLWIPILPNCAASFKKLMDSVGMTVGPHLAGGEGEEEPNASVFLAA